MNFGPLEFAVYLRREDKRSRESAAVKAARAAAATPLPEENILSVISGSHEFVRQAVGPLEAVRVYEAVATPPAESTAVSTIRVRVAAANRPRVLVLSSHRAVDWQLEFEQGATLEVVMLAGAGESTVGGAGDAPVASIGGFYAFKPGSLEFRHLEDEVRRCTRRDIESFQSHCSASRFDVGL